MRYWTFFGTILDLKHYTPEERVQLSIAIYFPRCANVLWWHKFNSGSAQPLARLHVVVVNSRPFIPDCRSQSSVVRRSYIPRVRLQTITRSLGSTNIQPKKNIHQEKGVTSQNCSWFVSFFTLASAYLQEVFQCSIQYRDLDECA